MRPGSFSRRLQWLSERREAAETERQEVADLRAKIAAAPPPEEIQAAAAALTAQERALELEAEFDAQLDAEIAEIDAELERLGATDESADLQLETAAFADRVADAIADRLESMGYA